MYTYFIYTLSCLISFSIQKHKWTMFFSCDPQLLFNFYDPFSKRKLLINLLTIALNIYNGTFLMENAPISIPSYMGS
jgi:hypothetical protein